MTEPDEQERTPRRGATSIAGLLLRLIAAPFHFAFNDLRLAFRSNLLRYGLLILVAAGAGWYGALALQQESAPSMVRASTVAAAAGGQEFPPSPVVEGYLQAQASFEAQGMWDALSSEITGMMEAEGAGPQDLQAELDRAWLEGRRYGGSIYVGGMPMRDGNAVYFYVITMDDPEGIQEIPYIYVVDKDGKIVSVQ